MSQAHFYRKSKSRDYSVIDNTFLRDKTLSLKAKGLFAYLLSLPEDWKIHVSEIVNHSSDGKCATRAAIKELIEHGYLVLERKKDGKGRYSESVYYIIEQPEAENSEDYPHTENRDSDNKTLLNTNIQNTKETNKENKENKDIKTDVLTCVSIGNNDNLMWIYQRFVEVYNSAFYDSHPQYKRLLLNRCLRQIENVLLDEGVDIDSETLDELLTAFFNMGETSTTGVNRDFHFALFAEKEMFRTLLYRYCLGDGRVN